MADVSNAILKIENHPLEATYMTDGTNHRDYSEIKSDIQNGLVKTSSDTTQNITGSITISGDLTVQGTQHITKTENLGVKNAMIYTNEDGTTLSVNGGIGIKKDSTNVYGIVYNPTDDAVELGLGTTTTDGTFTFNSGEGNPVAIRADSSSLFDGNLIAWDGTTLKLVDGGARPDTSKFVTTDTAQDILGVKTIYNATDAPYFVLKNHYNGLWTIKGSNATTPSGGYTITLPNKTGTLAVTTDIPDISGFVTTSTFTDAIDSANARIDKYKQSAIIDLGTQTTITDEQLATITADDYSGVVKWNTRYYSLQQISGASRIYTSNYLSSNYRITINTSTKAITTGSWSSITNISSYVKDNLTYSTSGTTYALSAYQGYLLNNKISGKQDTLSDAQIAATNSGITSTKVSTYDGYATTIAGKQAMITDSNKLDASLVSGLATVATTGSYNDLSDQPDIPAAITNYVTTDTNQTISGTKTFGSKLWLATEDSTPLDITFQYACSMVKFPVTVTLKPQTVSDDAGSYTLTLPAKDGTLATTSDIPTTYVSTVNGSSGAITNVAKTNVNNTFSLTQLFGSSIQCTSSSSNYLGSGTTYFGTSSTYSTRPYINSTSFCARSASNNYSLYGPSSITRYNGSSYTLTLPTKTGTIALTSDLPSSTNFVTIADTQTITGLKIFNDTGSGAIALKYNNGTYSTYFHPTSETQTSNLDIRLPNKSGTIALTSDLPTFSYSNNVLTITYQEAH